MRYCLKTKTDAFTKIAGDKLSGTISKLGAGKGQKENTQQTDVYAEIEKLFRLKEMGAITEDEFDAKKKELLNLGS